MVNEKRVKLLKTVLISAGVTLIVLSVAVVVVSLWESFGSLGRKVNRVTIPGFHDLTFKDPGLYGGIYQHFSPGPIPVEALSKLDVRLVFKETYDEVPVMVNTAGQTFSQFGIQGMPLFNFVIQEPGSYALSAFYPDGVKGPTVPAMIISHETRNIKQNLIVGAFFSILLLGVGIYILIQTKRKVPDPHKGIEKK